MIVRSRLFWIGFYIVLFLGIAWFFTNLYNSHSQDRLPSGHIELSVSQERYQLGDSIEFTVSNHFPTTIFVSNQCPEEPLYVYRWTENRWVQIHDIVKSRDSECYKQPRRVPVPANAELTYNFDDWPDLFASPGVYRIVMVVDHYDELPFQDFVVLEPAQVIEEPAPQVLPPTPVQQQQQQQEHEQEEEHEIEIED